MISNAAANHPRSALRFATKATFQPGFLRGVVRTPFSSSSSSAQRQWAAPTPEDADIHPADLVFAAGVRHHHTANTAYPIAHGKTLRPYRVPRVKDQERLTETIRAAYSNLDEMMVYVHVPFCAQRCQFCEYTVVDPTQGKQPPVQEKYFDSLLREIELYRNILGNDKKKIVGFDIGGGTPSMASIESIERVMLKADECFDIDTSRMAISIETTPRIAASQPEKIKSYFDMGIRRISMGVQTTDFTLAKRLGRDDGDYLAKAVENIRASGFESFNVDLMYGFPLRDGREDKDKWRNTIASTIELLSPDHITLYRMRYKGTKMAHLQERVGLQQINRQSEDAVNVLTDAGYKGWVGKNTFSRLEGDSGCSDYLEKRVVEGVPYLGFGLGAQSFSHSTLAYNLGGVTKRLHQYTTSVELGRLPIQDLYHLSASGAWAKFCSVSFYFGGIDLPSFEANFGLKLQDAFPDKVAFAIENGLMEIQGRRLQMTPLGKAHYSGVLALFYAPHVQRHLMELPGGEANATQYMIGTGSTSMLHANTNTAAPATDPRRPYVGNPLPRYERKRMKRQDPRVALPVDWAEAPPSVASNPAKRGFATSAFAQQRPQEGTTKERYEFGNILFGGPCNQRCVFCIGQQLPKHLSPRNHRDWPLANLDLFVDQMNESGTKRIILTGTTTDPQLYKHEGRLLDHLRESIPGAHISVHTNGLLALRKLDTFNQYDTATISVNSFVPETYARIHGVSSMPDIAALVANARPAIKLSCVLTAENVGEVESYLATAADLGVKRVALRHVFNTVGQSQPKVRTPDLLDGLVPVGSHCNNPVYDVGGVEVTYWKFDKTSGKSLNLFANGLLSDHYLLSKAPGAGIKG